MTKTFFSLIIACLISLLAFGQSYKTHLIVDSSERNLVKELYFVRDAQREIKEGTFKQYFKDSLITHGKYSNNTKTGLWRFYDYANKFEFSGEYVEGAKDGKWTFFLNGKVSSERYYSNGSTDSIFGFFENGLSACEVRRFADGSGSIKTYYDNGKLKELQATKNGSPDGICKIFFKNGQLHREITYSQAKIKTALSTFDMSGDEIDGGNLKDGNGSFVTYFLYDSTRTMDMKKCCNQQFNNSTLNGFCSHYFENGKLESAGMVEKDHTVGQWKYYKDDGNIKHILNYDYSPFSEKKKRLTSENFSGAEINIGERNPQFQGGEDEWINFLSQTVRYPNDALNYESNGIVYIQFLVSEIGEIDSYQIYKSVNKPLDNEAIRVTLAMPRWNPGLRYGIPVGMVMNMPLSFNLE